MYLRKFQHHLRRAGVSGRGGVFAPKRVSPLALSHNPDFPFVGSYIEHNLMYASFTALANLKTKPDPPYPFQLRNEN